MATTTKKGPAPGRSAEGPSALDMVAGLAEDKKGKGDRLTVTLPGLDDEIVGWIEADRRVKEWESKRDTHAAQIRAAAMPARVQACRRVHRVEASILVNGKVALTQKCQFSAIDPGNVPALREVFEDDTERYFLPSLQISLTPEASGDEATLKALIGALGLERFREVFTITRKVAVSEVFYSDLTLREEVEKKALPFIQAEVIKPYTPALRVA